MTIIKVKNTKVLDLPFLHLFVLRYMYEKEKMTVADIDLMMHSIVSWAKKSLKTPDEQKYLEHLGTLLNKAESGGYERRKALFKQHNIDWHKFERCPTELINKFKLDNRC